METWTIVKTEISPQVQIPMQDTLADIRGLDALEMERVRVRVRLTQTQLDFSGQLPLNEDRLNPLEGHKNTRGNPSAFSKTRACGFCVCICVSMCICVCVSTCVVQGKGEQGLKGS